MKATGANSNGTKQIEGTGVGAVGPYKDCA